MTTTAYAILANDSAYKAAMADMDKLQAARKSHQERHYNGQHGFNPYDAKIETQCGVVETARLSALAPHFDGLRAEWNASAKAAKSHQDITDLESRLGIDLYTLKQLKGMQS